MTIRVGVQGLGFRGFGLLFKIDPHRMDATLGL